MPPTPAMIAAARCAMEAALDLTAADRVLVVRDLSCGACGEAFAAAARAAGCEVRTFDLPVREAPLRELPARMLDQLDGVHVVINAIAGASEEVPVRIQWIHAIERKHTIRLGHAPGITEAMLTGGSLDVDYVAMQAREQRLLTALAGTTSLRITTAAGTDLTLDVTDRPFVSDLKATVACGVNLPCGEVYCAPVETGADGVLVVDGPVGGDGPPPAPVTIEVARGRVVRVACADAAWEVRVRRYMEHDRGASAICELGIGLNPGARLVGNMLEDEKALRTCHVAFGSNEGMPGGCNRSAMHIDYLVHRPTIVAGDRAILRDGDLAS